MEGCCSPEHCFTEISQQISQSLPSSELKGFFKSSKPSHTVKGGIKDHAIRPMYAYLQEKKKKDMSPSKTLPLPLLMPKMVLLFSF